MKIRSAQKGITLTSLVIIIIVIMMLTGVVTYVSYNVIVESKKASFLSDMTNVNDEVEEYYAINGSSPILGSGIEISASEYRQKVSELYGEDKLNSLEEELILNDDIESNFYEIDLTKLDVEASKFGVKKDENDIFLVSSNNIVYYYLGYKMSSGIYFSNVKLLEKN